MSTNTPPNPNVDTFNTLYWKTGTGQLTIEEADLRYLKFPVAQGTENLQTTNVNGILTANAGIKTNIIEAKTGAPGNRIDIGKSRLLGAIDCNNNAFTNFKSFLGTGTGTVQFDTFGYNLEIFGNIDMINSNITNINILSNDSPSGLVIENLQDVDMTFKTDTVTRLEIGTTIKAYVDMYMNNNSIYDTIRLQNSSLVNNLLIQSLNLPIAFEYLSLNKLTISADILLGTNLNCQNFHIINAEHVNGISNNNFPIRAVGTGHLQLFAGGTNRLTFRDTNECLADSNGLYIQGTTNTTSKIRLGYKSAAITQGDGSVSIGGGSGTNQGTNCIAIGQGTGISQNNSAIAIGKGAGVGTTTAQGIDAIAIGTTSGVTSQSNQSIAIGGRAGEISQGLGYTFSSDGGIAIGYFSGNSSQRNKAIAIGNGAGSSNQLQGAIAIGYGAGSTSQGANSIAIGTLCGFSSVAANSIALNATGSTFNPPTASSFYVTPMRMTGTGSAFLMYYNPTSKEVGYDTSSRRNKKDIIDLEVDTSVLHKFSPKSFKFISHGEDAVTNYGFIEEDLEELNPILVGYDEEGLPQGIHWNTITMFNIGEIQALRKELDGTVNIMRVMLDDMTAMKNEMELLRNELNLLKGSSPQI